MLEDRTVVDVSQKNTQSGKTMYVITLNDGIQDTKYNVFNSTHAHLLYGALKQSKPVHVGFKQNGEYTNIVEVLSEAEASDDNIPILQAPVKKAGAFGGGRADPNKLISIERQSSMKQAVELVASGQVEVKDLIPSAEKIYKWIHDV